MDESKRVQLQSLDLLPRTAGRSSAVAIQGFNMPISAAPENFLWFREAKVEFFRSGFFAEVFLLSGR